MKKEKLTRNSLKITKNRKRPLLIRYRDPHALLKQRIARAVAAASVTQFYFPFKMPNDSEENKDEVDNENCSLKGENLDYRQHGQKVVATALDILFSGGWIREKSSNSEDVIESKYINGIKIFRMQAVLHTTPVNMMKILYDSFESQPKWNPTVQLCKILRKIDADTDITYTVTAPSCQGMVSSRDFVVLRHRAAFESSFIISSISVESHFFPESKIYVRGENGPSCFVITPLKNDPNRCELRWLINTNLKGWLPKSLVDSAFSSAINDFLLNLRKYIRS